MDMEKWAEREVEIACKREAPERNSSEWDYGCACYESALKAFKSLMEDNHSGMSFSFTKGILTRLMDGKPLTPIEDVPEVWNDVSLEYDETKSYQCKRMSSLFKKVHPDGRVEYSDVRRTVCYNVGREHITYSSGHASRLINSMYPIKMPYMPPDGQYVMECEELLTDRKNGDFDTWAYLTLKTPEGETRSIARYFKEENGRTVEIKPWEYLARKQLHNAREDREAKEKEGTF